MKASDVLPKSKLRVPSWGEPPPRRQGAAAGRLPSLPRSLGLACAGWGPLPVAGLDSAPPRVRRGVPAALGKEQRALFKQGGGEIGRSRGGSGGAALAGLRPWLEPGKGLGG